MSIQIKAHVSLETGDHLTREELHRRYCARPDLKKAELIEGVVYVPSPVRFDRHAEKTGAVSLWLGTYALRAPGARFGNDGTIFLDGGNEPQPDVILWRFEPGGPYLNDDGYIVGAPQLVVEVAASSVSYDLYEKKEAYRRNGVREYIVWRVLDDAIDWFRLQNGAYVLIQPDTDGVIESTSFRGLRLHVASVLEGNLDAVLAALRAPSGQ